MIRGAVVAGAQASVRAAARAPARATVRAPGAAILALLLLALTLPIPVAQAADRRRADDGWAARPMSQAAIRERDQAALSELPAHTRVGYHPGTGRVRFLSGSPRRPLTASLAAVASGKRRLTVADARSSASRFVDRYGGLFGLASPSRELRARQARRHWTSVSSRGPADSASDARPADSASTAGAMPSNVTVRFDQSRAGLPVMGGQIVVQLSGQGEVVSAAGEVLPSAAEVDIRPRLSSARAGTIAATWLSRPAGRSPSAVTVRSEGLALFDPRIMSDLVTASAGPRLVWRIDARLPASRGQEARHQLVVVDAHGGQVLTSIGRIYRVERIVCDNQGAPGRSFRCEPPFTRGEGQASSGVADVDAVYRLMGVVDEFFAGRFGRSGLDGQGARLKATVRYCAADGCPWRNAEWKWAEQQAIFGSGWAQADDIVAHELTHGLLDDEVPLFYHYQSGAINESLADIFGELVDLSYPGGTDTAATLWRIGEDTPGGAFRDMRDPTRFGHPDRVLSPRWFTGSSDDGGVHHNSGVGNKAASLIADGGRFRGYDLAGIGRIQTARVFYQAVTTRLTPAANYIDLADALVAACIDLAGSEGLTSAQCSTVRDAVAATQMSSQPKHLAPRRAPLCAPGKRALDVFFDDLEDPAAGRWVIEGLAGGRKGWYYPQNPNHDPSWDGTWASSGRINFFAPNRDRASDTTIGTRSPVLLPAGAFLRFEHGYAFDSDAKRRYDGGVVEIKTGAGPWQDVHAFFTHGGYNGRIARGFGNALAGRRAYTANSHGWSAARVDLAPFAGAWLKLRFRMASDRVVSGRGWYIDDIRVYSCADDADKPSGTLSIADGAASTSDPNVPLSLTYADATTWVTHLRVSGSAQLDAAGQLLQGITMPIRDRLAWTLTDTASGGLDGLGSKWVHAQVRDAAGNWSDVFSDDIELLAAA